MKKVLSVLALLLLPTAVGAQQDAGDSATIAAVADSIAAEMLSWPVAGVAIGVARGGQILYRKAHGFRDVEAERPLTLDDPHQIGSLTKQFTAAAVLQLVEEGRIALDDSVQTYVPDFDTQGHTVTIHHLLNHTSGIRSYTAIYGMNPVPRESVLDTIQKHPFDFAPGERFLYNNSGYYLLGVVIEAAAGVPYGRYLEERIFEPLGLESTHYCGYEGREVPEGYQRGEQGLTRSVLSDMTFPGAAGGLCSTVDDLLRWQEALISGAVVNPDSWARMSTPDTLSSGESMSYGYGLVRTERLGRDAITHGGGIPGFNTYLSYYPDDGLAIVLLVNSTPGQPETAEQPVARAAFGLPRLVIADLPLTAEERERFHGTYDLGELQVRVFDEDDLLWTQATSQRALRMKYQGELTFLLDTPQEIRLVFEVEDGRAARFTLYQGGREVVAERTEEGG
jgi:D-alanyl-D-alanine carboxypeptidase